MSYKSPIEIIYLDDEFRVETAVVSMEETIIKAVQSYDINIDKDELIKALSYDRGQYEKGYADGRADRGAEIVRCKDCKHRIVNEHYGKKGYLKIKAMCECDTGDPFELGRCAEDDDWFCGDGERKDEEEQP